MRIRARAAALCAVAVAVLAVVPTAATADVLPPVIDSTIWPGNSAGDTVPNNPNLPSSLDCEPGDGTKTFTFAQTADGMLLYADGTFSEQGSFAVARVDGVLRVTAFDSTFSAASPAGTVQGERHLRESEIGRTTVTCTGPSDDRDFQIIVPRAHSDATVTYATGDVATDHGWGYMVIGGYDKRFGRAGWYFSQFNSDQDRDEVRYVEDNCKTIPNPDQANGDRDAQGDACDWDLDNDERANEYDNCPNAANADQADADHDGIGDVCDPRYDAQDADGDGVVDTADNCPTVPNADQADSGGSAAGDACDDRDSDGVGDLVDNCVSAANPTQADLDGDRAGDACDPDDDGDTVADAADNCARVANPTQRDSDADGKGDACDGAFDSNDGFVGGGGKLAGGAQFSVAVHSQAGVLHGTGQLADGAAGVRLLDVSGLRSSGSHAVVVGRARLNGSETTYRLEVNDGPDTFELEVGDRRWGGALTNGNVVVR